MENKGLKIMCAILRIVIGVMFLWPFIDKLLGLGYSTAAENAWIRGGSPTEGFLKFGASGPFAPIYNRIGGTVSANWLFMLALLLIGLALILGIGMKVATISGAVLLFLQWSVVLPKANNIFLLDEHIIYILVLIGLYFARAGQTAGLGRLWAKTRLVKKAPALE